MLPLVTGLGSGQTSPSFTCHAGWFLLTLAGDFSGESVAIQMSPTGPNGTFGSYIIPDPAGVLTAEEFTDDGTKLYVGAGQTFRCVCSAGGTPDIDIYVSGAHITPHRT